MKYKSDDLKEELNAFDRNLLELDADLPRHVPGTNLDLKFEGIREIEENNRTWYIVKMYIDGDLYSLNQIIEVDYILHPTFSEQIIKSNDRNSNFEKFIKIWGFFTVRAKVHLQGGKTIELARPIDI